MCEKTKKDLVQQSEIGQKIAERNSKKKLEETHIPHQDQSRTNSFSGPEGDGERWGFRKAGHCGVGDRLQSNTQGRERRSGHKDYPPAALDATTDGATELSVYSPDNDVLVLAIRRYLRDVSKYKFCD